MKTRHCAIGIAVLAALIYLNALPNGFVSDDNQLIFEHPYTQKVADWPAIFTTGHYAGGGGYRPLVTLSFAINYLVGGNNPIGYHAINILLHALNSALVFLLLRRLMRSLSIALIGAVVFAVHPIHAEAVAWISGRAELMAAAFFLGGWILYLRSTETTSISPATFATSLLLFFAALLSKENALIFPAAIILGDLFRARVLASGEVPQNFWRKRWSILYPCLFGGAAFYFAFRWILYWGPLLRVADKIQYVDNPLAPASTPLRLLTAIKVQGDYLWLLIWPRKLCGDYSFNSVPLVNNPLDPAVLISFGIIVALLVITAISFIRRGRIWFGILFYFLAIFPVSNFVTIIGTIKAERLLYLPSLGFCAIAAVVWKGLFTQSRKRIQETMTTRQIVALALLVVVIALGGWRTWRRNPAWGNENRFWMETAAVAPDNIKAWLNVGYRAFKNGRDELAAAAFRQALRINPDSADALMNLGVVLMRTGENEEAITIYEEAVNRHPERAALHVDLGLASAATGKMATAIGEFRRAAELEPKNPVIHFDLGLALSSSNDSESALSEYRTAVELNPNYAEGWNALGAVFIKLHRPDDARAALKKALELKPDYKDAIYNLTLIDAPR